jgi:hypothetical protein
MSMKAAFLLGRLGSYLVDLALLPHAAAHQAAAASVNTRSSHQTFEQLTKIKKGRRYSFDWLLM